jgi:predicted metalloprotease with PDZ domain
MPLKTSRLLRVGTLLSTVLGAASCSPPVDTQDEPDHALPRIAYRITPVPRTDRTDLDVQARLDPPWPERIEIAPPLNCYGSAFDLAESLVSLDVEGVPPLPPRDAGSGGWTIALPRAGATIRYRLSFDPDAMERDAFSPNTSATHFHVAGCQWMLTIGDMSERREVSVAFDNVPDDWSVYSSLAASGGPGSIIGTEEETAPTAIGGQRGRPRVFEVEGRPVEAFAADGFDIAADRIADWVERIVTRQRERMGVFEIPFYTVAVRPRANVIAGTAIDNLFIAFVRPDASRADIVRNISHEMFHNFIPERLEVVAPDGDSWVRHMWFAEGLVEYMARALLLEQGLLTAGEMAERINRDLRDLGENPFADRPIAAFETIVREGGALSQTMKNVSYARGALLAAGWDGRLRRDGDLALADVLRGMISQEGDSLSEDRFFDLMAGYGLDARTDFERHVVRGERIVPDPDLLGPAFELRRVETPSFDPGFDLGSTVESGRLRGVDADGPAFAAGLREGMPLVRLENASRFSSSWSERAPLVVTVSTEDGPQRFDVMPLGPPVGVLQFLPVN